MVLALRYYLAVYKPRRKGVESKFYVCEFVYQGRRFQESTGATSKTVAKEYEKRRRSELERAHAGIPIQRTNRIRSVAEANKAYLDGYRLNHREASITFAENRLKTVDRCIGKTLLSDLTEDAVRSYIRRRLTEDVGGRTINAELGELSRAIGHEWKALWPKIRKLEENEGIGIALSAEHQHALLDAVEGSRSPIIRTWVPLLLLTGMRSGEAFQLQWLQVDLLGRTIQIGKAKTAGGSGRTIPINDDLLPILKAHRQWFTERFGQPKPNHYLFPWGKPTPLDPTRHAKEIKTAWRNALATAKIHCRPHDLRHTCATQLAELGTPESTMLALLGWMSRRMLEHYSHIRMAAKRTAVAGVRLRPKRSNDLE